ncbi:MAG TPA: DUF1343 domain-containing protein [Anaerolineae bacterium]|nr:DUF1343 domain-containing protein [Anaerolineae bacterium]HOR00917.1 DUF1343 domain-containing protein [Anaerolineae bacterium]HPL30613.1 DUF1343 domain-containing protein [Anaerolineae bacterium]
MIKTGLQVLLRERRDLMSGRRVGLLTHSAAVQPDLTGTRDALLGAEVEATALIDLQEGDTAGALCAAQLAAVDLLVVDLQENGARCSTVGEALFGALQAAAGAGCPMIVLDRPNPSGGALVEGPVAEPGFVPCAGGAGLPMRHGLTLGEMAGYLNEECGLGATLTVIGMRGWRRAMYFDDAGLPWVPLEPGLRSLVAALLYPGTCLLDGTNLSAGAGSPFPFEVAGAPWLEGDRLAEVLNAQRLPGVRCEPLRFVPGAGRYAGEPCGGVRLRVAARGSLRPVAATLHLIAAARTQAPRRFEFLPGPADGRAPLFDRLAGTARLRQGLEAGLSAESLVQSWEVEVARFEARRKRYLLYS